MRYPSWTGYLGVVSSIPWRWVEEDSLEEETVEAVTTASFPKKLGCRGEGHTTVAGWKGTRERVVSPPLCVRTCKVFVFRLEVLVSDFVFGLSSFQKHVKVNKSECHNRATQLQRILLQISYILAHSAPVSADLCLQSHYLVYIGYGDAPKLSPCEGCHCQTLWEEVPSKVGQNWAGFFLDSLPVWQADLDL